MRPTAASRWNNPTWKFMIASLVVFVMVLAFTIISAGRAVAADTPDGVGLLNPATGQWHLLQEDGSSDSFYFGRPGDVPIFGDWDCDGTDTAGMFRPSSGFAYLTNRNQTSAASIRFHFGEADDLPIVGDWNGNGCDTLGVYRAGEVLLRNSLTTGPADIRFFFGNPGDRPFVGDFDNDGVSTLGLYRTNTGFVYFRNSLSTGPGEHHFFYGESGDRVIAGDWNDDGTETIGIFRPNQARFYLSNRNGNQQADRVFDFGEPSWFPVAGTFDAVTAPPPPPNPLPAADVGSILFRVNAGGPEIAATDGGPNWSADTAADPSAHTNALAALSSVASWNVSITDSSVASPVPREIFATERWDQPAGDEMTWRFPVPKGELVKVNLYFASGYDPVGAPGKRAFNVRAGRFAVTKGFDIAASAGHRVGTRRSYYEYSEQGFVDVWFEHVINNPQLSGIEIVRQPGPVLSFDGDGSPTENGDFLRFSLAEVAGFGPLEPWIAELGPGIFASRNDAHDPTFRLVDNLTVRGAGQDMTTLAGANTMGAAVSGVSGSRLENVTIQVGNAPGARGILNQEVSAAYRNVTVNAHGAQAAAIANIDTASTFDNVTIDATSFAGATVVNNVRGAPRFLGLTVEANSQTGIVAVRNEAASPVFDGVSISVSSDSQAAYGMVTTSGSVVAGSGVTITAPGGQGIDAGFYGIFSRDSIGNFSGLTILGSGTYTPEIGTWIVGGEAHLENATIEIGGAFAAATGVQIESGAVSIVQSNVTIAGDGVGVSADNSDVTLETTAIKSGTALSENTTGILITNGFLEVSGGAVDARGRNSAVAVSLEAVEANLTAGSYLAASTSSASGFNVVSGRLTVTSIDVTASAISPVAVVVVDSLFEATASTMIARDGAEGTVLQNRNSDITIESSTLAVDAGGGRATGIENVAAKRRAARSGDPTGVVRVLSSTVTAATHMVLNLAGVPTFLEESTLDGGDITDPDAQVFCKNVTDENGVFYEETCPPGG